MHTIIEESVEVEQYAVIKVEVFLIPFINKLFKVLMENIYKNVSEI